MCTYTQKFTLEVFFKTLGPGMLQVPPGCGALRHPAQQTGLWRLLEETLMSIREKKVASAYVFKGTNVLEAAEARNSPRLEDMKERRSLLLAQGPEVELPPPSPFALPTASGPFSGIFLCSLPAVHMPNLGEAWGVSFSDHLMSFSSLFSPPNFCQAGIFVLLQLFVPLPKRVHFSS